MRRLSPLLLLLLPTSLPADEVFLKGAGSLSGRIVEHTEEVITVDIGDGMVSVPSALVERIEKGKTPLDEYDERAATLRPEDADGWRNLGRWSANRGLASQSRQAYQRVVATVPGDAEAREALGYVNVDGTWLTEEESYRARGYVRYDGEWMTPAEVQMAKADEASDAAAREAERRAAEAAAAQSAAQYDAQRAAQKARDDENDWIANTSDDPMYWGGWGYGVSYWPTTPVVRNRPARPAQLPARPAGGRR